MIGDSGQEFSVNRDALSSFLEKSASVQYQTYYLKIGNYSLNFP